MAARCFQEGRRAFRVAQGAVAEQSASQLVRPRPPAMGKIPAEIPGRTRSGPQEGDTGRSCRPGRGRKCDSALRRTGPEAQQCRSPQGLHPKAGKGIQEENNMSEGRRNEKMVLDYGIHIFGFSRCTGDPGGTGDFIPPGIASLSISTPLLS